MRHIRDPTYYRDCHLEETDPKCRQSPTFNTPYVLHIHTYCITQYSSSCCMYVLYLITSSRRGISLVSHRRRPTTFFPFSSDCLVSYLLYSTSALHKYIYKQYNFLSDIFRYLRRKSIQHATVQISGPLPGGLLFNQWCVSPCKSCCSTSSRQCGILIDAIILPHRK